MKTKKSYDYWRKRQDERLAYSERVSNHTVANIADVYDDSLSRVEKRIENILDNYSKSVKMPKDQLKDLLSQHDKEKLLRELQDDFIKNGANTRENMEWLRGNYLHRLNEQESIKLQLENERRIIAENEKAISTLGYKKTIEETYKSLTKDLTGSTRHLNESAKNSMLNKRWVAGKNYSERVWNNTGRLSNQVNKVINYSLISGVPKQQIIHELSERYEVARYRAETLVRTEMNYFENQSELKSYKDLGVTHYIYFAVRDNRTSDICSNLDGKRFAVKEAKAGLNYPPMHPNCRAGTLPDLEFKEDYRVYKNPITRKREKTTKSYEDWLKGIEDAAETKYNINRDRIEKPLGLNTFKTEVKMDWDNLKEKFTFEEITDIHEYSKDLYKPINEYFRTGNGTDKIASIAKNLNNTINKSELNQDVVVRRGVTGKTLKELGTPTLGVHTLKGIVSTTINPGTSKEFMNAGSKRKVYYEIIVPEKSKALYISKTFQNIRMKEKFYYHIIQNY